MNRPEIAIALDVENLEAAAALERRVGPGEEWVKIGLELFTSAGPPAVEAMRARGRRVFLDLKLHDIPSTAERAAAAAASLGVELLTVHASGSAEMVSAAVRGAASAGGGARVVAVTLLTSLSADRMPPGFIQPFPAEAVVVELTRMALAAGAAGVVCSGAELAGLRRQIAQPFFAVTPGIRGSGEAAQDQRRTATVAEAVAAGADLLVIGRPVTRAADPAAALAHFREECRRAWERRLERAGTVG